MKIGLNGGGEMKKEVSLGDFVKYLVLLLHMGGVKFYFSTYEPWHLLFYRLKKIPKISGKPQFLENLRFDWDGPYPKSQELSEFLSALCSTGCVVTTSPSYKDYTLPENMSELWSREFELLSNEIKQFLCMAVELVKEELQKFNH